MFTRALTLPADGLILDLEDAVAPDRKAATRGVVREWLARHDFGGRERWVRMNPIATGLGEADLEETIAGRPDGYVVPKPGRAADIREIARVLDRLEQQHGIPNGATRLTVIATASRPASIAWVRELGADHVVDHTRDLAPQLAALGTPEVDYVFCLSAIDPYVAALPAIVAPQGKICAIVGTAKTYVTPGSDDPRWRIIFVRCASPPDSVPDGRSSER